MGPSAAESLAAGLGWTLSSPGPAIWVVVVQAILVLPWAFGAGWLADDLFGRSVEAARFARSIDVVLVAELFKTQALGFHTWLVTLAGAGLVFVATSTFLTGGLIATAGAPRPSARFFFAEGGRALPRLLRLLGLSIPFFGLVVMLPGVVILRAADSWAEDALSDGVGMALRVSSVLLVATIAALTLAAIDAMKIQRVRKPDVRLWRVFRHGLAFAWTSPIRTLVLYLPYPCLLLGLVVAWAWVDVRIGRSGWALWALGLAWQQLGAVVRGLLRSAWVASLVFHGWPEGHGHEATLDTEAANMKSET
ncbi:MAG: hypothetical protein IPK13_24140 [Deltaproteobacteria bacterium]|nr:hypothetical protein [Deltaproteobacteria bacterium]